MFAIVLSLALAIQPLMPQGFFTLFGEEYRKQIDLYSMTRRASTTEEPTLEDIVLKRKKSRTTSIGSPGVIFVQVVPPEARQEFDHAANSRALESIS
jgi:hypothetical protein